MWRISAVRPGGHVSPEPCSPAWPTVTSGAAIGQPGTAVQIRADVAAAIVEPRSLPFALRKLALEELTATTNGPKRVTGDDEQRRITREHISAAGAALFGQGLSNAFSRAIRLLGPVDELW